MRTNYEHKFIYNEYHCCSLLKVELNSLKKSLPEILQVPGKVEQKNLSSKTIPYSLKIINNYQSLCQFSISNLKSFLLKLVKFCKKKVNQDFMPPKTVC